jgi:hypothetical protein
MLHRILRKLKQLAKDRVFGVFILSIVAFHLVVLLPFFFVRDGLKRDSKALLLPKERRYVYSPAEVKIDDSFLEPGPPVETVPGRLGSFDGTVQVADQGRGWEIEAKMPQRLFSQVLQAFDPNDPDKPLEVDLTLKNLPTRTYKAKIYRKNDRGEANANREDGKHGASIVVARLRIEGEDIKDLIANGSEVIARFRLGNEALFYGVWGFFHENSLPSPPRFLGSRVMPDETRRPPKAVMKKETQYELGRHESGGDDHGNKDLARYGGGDSEGRRGS